MLPRAEGSLTFEMHFALERADELHFKIAECVEELTSLPDHIQLMMHHRLWLYRLYGSKEPTSPTSGPFSSSEATGVGRGVIGVFLHT